MNRRGSIIVVSLLMAVPLLGYFGVQARASSASSQQAAACALSPDCQNRAAWTASIMSKVPVQSTTGKWFFRFTACASSCAEEQAGYQWAATASTCATVTDTNIRRGCKAYFAAFRPAPGADALLSYPDDKDPTGPADLHGY